MKIETKKIIAREFLILTIIIALAVVAYFATGLYNLYERRQIEKTTVLIKDKITLAVNLSRDFNLKSEKQNKFFKKVSDKFEMGEFDTKDKFWKRLEDISKEDSVKIKWDKSWKTIPVLIETMGFSNPNEFKNFIDKTGINSKDINQYNNANELYKEIKNLNNEKKYIKNRILSYSKQIKFTTNSFLILIFLLFILRYLFYAIQWSISTLKQEN